MNDRRSVSVAIKKEPELGRRLRVNVTKRIGFTEIESKRHASAASLLEIVVNSAEFKAEVLNRTFTTTNKTSRQVYDLMMTGREVLQKDVDYEIDVTIKIYEENNKTVGYTYANTVQTWVNRKFFGQYELGQIAGNMFHEWMHKLGFNHSSATDYKSVPYSLGYLVTEMVGDFEGGRKYVDLYPDPTFFIGEKVCERSALGLKKSCWYEKAIV